MLVEAVHVHDGCSKVGVPCPLCAPDIWSARRADHPMAVAHIAPPVRSATPAKKIAVSNRVNIQLFRMVRLNCWTVSE
jgi:hypothetical protein